MEQVIRIFRELQETSGKNDKISIIKCNADNRLFKECLKFLLDDNVVTGISKKKLDKSIVVTDELYISKIQTWQDCMNYLITNNTGKDVDIREMQIFISNQPPEHQEFYKQMITKSLKLGCDSKSVNKAIPDLIPTWEVQLGSPYDKLKLKNNEYFYLSRKLNGCRCSFVNGELLSRQGKKFTGLQHIIDDIENISLENYFIDGELIRKNIDNLSDTDNFSMGTGIINSDAETKEEIKLVIFDIFPVEELANKESTYKYAERKNNLLKLQEVIDGNKMKNIEVVKMVYEGTDQSKIDEWLQYAVEHDWEGLMLNKNATWKGKRTADLIKIKRFYTMDLEVVDVIEGDGRLKGTFGAFVVKYKDNIVNVGSGYSDDLRTEIWNNKDEMIGKIIEVKYKEITKDKKTGLESLQFPVFVRFRDDKTEESYN